MAAATGENNVVNDRLVQLEIRMAALEAIHPQLTDAELAALERGIADAKAGDTVNWDDIPPVHRPRRLRGWVLY